MMTRAPEERIIVWSGLTPIIGQQERQKTMLRKLTTKKNNFETFQEIILLLSRK